MPVPGPPTVVATVPTKPSLGYGGQLYRGALVPTLSRWYPEKPSLLVGTANNVNRKERAARLRQRDPKAPVGFFSKRGRIVPKRSLKTMDSQSLRVGSELMYK